MHSLQALLPSLTHLSQSNGLIFTRKAKRKASIGIFLLLALGCAIVWHGGRILAAHMAPTLNRSHSGTDNAGAQRNTTASVMVAGNTRAACPEFVTAGDLIPPESNVSLEDLNGDRRVDAYLFRSSGLTVWINDGTGRFSAATNYPAPATFLSFFDPGDLNGDGKRDFLFRYTIGNTTYMAAYRNKGDGTYEIVQTITLLQIGAAIAGGTTSYSASYPGDFNGDSKIDFLTAVRVNRIDGTSTIGRILIFRNNGDGTFTTDPALDFLDTSASNEFSLVEDFNLDGVMDFALQQSRFGFISGILIYRRVSGATNLSFSETQRISVTQSSSNPRIFWSYLDGFNPPNPPVSSDNYLDVQIQGTSISSWYGSASGMFSQTPPTGNPARDTAPQVNLNNDGIRDSYQIRGVTAADSDLIIQYGNSNGTLRTVATVRIKGSPSVDIADFNGDGKNDFGLRLLGAGNNLSYSLVISGTGETYSTTSLEVNLGTGVSSIKAVSLNGDNKMDLAVTKGSAISMLINNSDCVIAPANTATGSNVTVSSNNTSVTFSNVTTAGTTTITPITPATTGILPNGFVIPGGSVAYEITTSAVFSGPLTLTFNVPGVTDAATFTTLRVLHGEGTPQTLIDRTVLSPETPAPNFTTKQISARVSSLSPFVIAAQQPPQTCVTAPANLAAWFRGENNANDAAGTNNGALQNGLTFVAGKVGQAFSFDGVDDSIQIPASNSLNVGAGAGLTIAMWVNPADLQPHRMLAEWNTGSAFGLHFLHSYNFPEAGAVPGALYVNFGSGAIFQTGAGVVTPNEWQHLAITYDKTSGVARFYRNGLIVKEQNFGSLTPGTTANLYLGVRPNNTLLRYKGLMDETDIFSRALTLSEIQSIFNAGSAGKCVPVTNTPPTITAANNVSTQQGNLFDAPGRVAVPLATVTDGQDQSSALTVSTSSGTASGLFVRELMNVNGTITAKLGAACNATSGTVRLQVTDSGGLTATVDVPVSIAANTPPTIGTYANQSITAGSAISVSPSEPPSDNASVGMSVSGVSFASVSQTGVVSIPPSVQVGTYTVTVSATDNCGAITRRNFTLTVAPTVCVTAPANLIAWYRGESNANDATGANNGSLQNGAAFAAGKVGQAFSFDGVDDYVTTNATLGNFRTNEYSIEFWLRTTATRQEAILGKRSTCSPGSFFDIRNVEGKLYAELNGGDVIRSTVNINDGVFHHIVVQRSASGLRLYLDGTLNNGTVTAGGITDINNDAVFWLGRSACTGTDNTNYFTGQLDEVSLYQRALTATEVQGLFDAGALGKCVTANTTPTITAAAALTRQQGSAAGAAVTIATVSDAQTPAGNLTVTATTVPTGLTVTNITNTNGTIAAQVAADCNATVGANTVVLTVSDGSLTATANLTMVVTPNSPPTLGPYANGAVTIGESITIRAVAPPADNVSIRDVTVVATGAVTFRGSLTINPQTGDITVTDAKPIGSFTLRATVTDNCGATATQSIPLTVRCPHLFITQVDLPNGAIGTAYNQTLLTLEGSAPYTYRLTTGTLPNGITLSNSGTISGTPTVSGSFPFTVQATDANGCTATRNLVLTIAVANCPAITINPPSLPNAVINTPYSQTLTPTGGTPPYTFEYLRRGGPISITFNTNGTISGFVSSGPLGSFVTCTVKVTDANGCSSIRDYAFEIVNPTPTLISLNPSSATAGGPGFALLVNGTNFIPGASVVWNQSVRTATFINSTQLRVDIPASDIATAGTAQVTVTNPSPGGGFSNPLTFTIAPATATRYEGDVWPRNTGDGRVDLRDVQQMTRFVLRLAPPIAGGEFQRADTAPKASKGDRRITTADVVQVARYAAGLDQLVEAGGPTTPALQDEPTATAENLAVLQTGSLAATAGNFTRGQIGTVAIQANALGTESAVSFTLNYDIAKLSFLDAMPVNLSGAQVFVNDSIPGQVAVLVLLSAGQTLPAGVTTILNLRFLPNGGAGQTAAAFTFGDEIIAREATDAAASMQQVLTTTNANNTVNGNAPAFASAASYLGGAVAPADSIVAIFGVNLATATAIGRTIPLPTELAGTTVTLTDSTNKLFAVPLFFVSSGQINCLIPAGAASGAATVTIRNSNGATTTGLLRITDVNPGLFAAAGNGRGLAAAQVLRVFADGTQRYENVARFDTTSNQFVPVPIDVSNANEQVFLVLYGTGLRARSNLAEVSATLGGSINGEVLYAGAQGSLAGLDQINLRLTHGIAGRGAIDVAVTVDGKATNTIRLFIR